MSQPYVKPKDPDDLTRGYNVWHSGRCVASKKYEAEALAICASIEQEMLHKQTQDAAHSEATDEEADEQEAPSFPSP